MKKSNLNADHTSEIIYLAWKDKASFDAIREQFGLFENDVIRIMRKNLKPKSFKIWRERVSGRASKHKRKLDFK